MKLKATSYDEALVFFREAIRSYQGGLRRDEVLNAVLLGAIKSTVNATQYTPKDKVISVQNMIMACEVVIDE